MSGILLLAAVWATYHTHRTCPLSGRIISLSPRPENGADSTIFKKLGVVVRWLTHIQLLRRSLWD